MTAEEVVIMKENGTGAYDDGARDAVYKKLERRYTKDSISRIEIIVEQLQGTSFVTKRFEIYYWKDWGIALQVDQYGDDNDLLERTRLVHVIVNEPMSPDRFEFSLRENEVVDEID